MTERKKITIIMLAIGLRVMVAGLTYAQRTSAVQPTVPANYATSTEWPTYGHDSGGMRYSPLTQITSANVTSLKVAWVYHLKPEDYVAAPARGGRGGGAPEEGAAADATARGGGRGGPGGPGGRGGGSGLVASEGTPLVAGGMMYISSPYGRVVALDATTGKEAWVYKLPSGSPAGRGVEYFAGNPQTPSQIVVTTSDS